MTVEKCGLFISIENPWLAGTPDALVCDFADDCSQSLGLVEIKNPYSTQCMTLSEAVKKSSFCLQKSKDSDTYRLLKKHDYYYQIQCQLYCTEQDWCDFVVNTKKEMHVERKYYDASWWTSNIEKLKDFYFCSLLPELACPRHYKRGIRELVNQTSSEM